MFVHNAQQPGNKQNAKQDAAKPKPKGNAAAGQDNKTTNKNDKNTAQKSKEENAEAALEKDVDELRKAIDGESKFNSLFFQGAPKVL